MNAEEAVEDALCCLMAVFRAEGTPALLAALPEGRRAAIEERLRRISGLPTEEVLQRFRKVREADVTGAIASSGIADPVVWKSLPRPLQQWLANRM